MGFLVLNILLALISAGAFWVATRPTGGSRTLATRSRIRRPRQCNPNHPTARQRVKRQPSRGAPPRVTDCEVLGRGTTHC